jgi:hypothetical protein
VKFSRTIPIERFLPIYTRKIRDQRAQDLPTARLQPKRYPFADLTHVSNAIIFQRLPNMDFRAFLSALAKLGLGLGFGK